MAESNPSTNFFSQLKLVCRNIEHGIVQLQKEVETRTSSRSAGKAVIELNNLKHEIQQMKTDGRHRCQTLDSDGTKFDELLASCHSLIDVQNNRLHSIEAFMKQYGYKEFKPADTAIEEITEENKENVGEDESKEKEKQSTLPQEEKPNRSRTPQPEDFGISKYTLKAMKRGFSNVIQQDFTTRFQEQPSSEARIPSVFNQDEFVSLTPSVFGRHVPFNTPGKYQEASPSFCDFLTPANKKLNDPEQKYGADLPKLKLAVDSPEPPVFQTPGVKHLGKKDYFETAHTDLTLKNNIQQSVMDSPQVPDFKSESARKLIGKGIELPKEPCVRSSQARLYDEMPQTPELTCNIRNLREMAGITKESVSNQNAQKENREPAPPTFLSKNIGDTISTMPREFKPLSDHHDVISNVTPPMPEMLTDRASKFKSNNNQARDLSKTPPMPKFLSQYANDLVQKKNF